MSRRTKGEQRAYLDGYEMCGECIEKYLTEDGKKRLNALIMSVRNAVDIEDLPNSAEGEYIKKEDVLAELEKWEWQELYLPIHFKENILDVLPTYSFPDREKGEWIHDNSKWENRFNCSKCGYKLFEKETNFCPNCGTQMREIEVWNGIHRQMVAPKGTFDKLFEEAKEDDDFEI